MLGARCKITLQHCLCAAGAPHTSTVYQHLSCVTAQPRATATCTGHGTGFKEEKRPLCLLGDLASPHTACSPRLKVAGTTSCQHNPHGFSWDAQGRHGFPTHGCTCISHPLLVNRSQSLSIEGSSATFGSKHSAKKQQNKISSSKRKAAHNIFKVRLPPITILSPPKYANTLSTSLIKYSRVFRGKHTN